MSTQQTPTGPGTGKRGIGTVGIVTAVVGGVVLLGVGASAAFGMAISSQRAVASQIEGGGTVDTAGVTGLDLNIGVAELTLAFGDVQDATLVARGGSADRWELGRDGDEITVRAPKVDSSGFCFFGVCPSTRGQHVSATLTLPNELADREIDANIRVGVGEVRAAGNFGDLALQVDAGDATVTGSAQSVSATIGVGSIEGELDGVRTLKADVALGELEMSLTGNAPTDVALTVNAGSIDLEVPDGVYDVTSRGGAGSIENRLRTVPGAPNRISAQVDLGDITITTAR